MENITIKTPEEVAAMRQAGRIVATILGVLSRQVKANMKTLELDAIAEKELDRLGAKSSFKGYRGYPATVCVSVNDEIVHGIPGQRVLREGDIVSLDFGAIFMGYQADAAVTVGIGQITPKAKKLMDATAGALGVGINAARAGSRLGDISAAIQNYAESKGFAVIREYTGHGIGREMHEDPLIRNFGTRGTGPLLKKGMTFALEPMLATGDWHARVADDNWTVLTADGGLAAHFEHTIAINDGEPEILTREVYA